MISDHNQEKKNLFSHKLNVRIDDINFGNHLCHSKFTTLLHNTRALYLKQYGLSESNCFGLGIVVLNLNIRYKANCFFDDSIEILISLDKLEKASIILEYTVFNLTSNKIAAKASTRIGFIDVTSGKLKKIPKEFIELINKN